MYKMYGNLVRKAAKLHGWPLDNMSQFLSSSVSILCLCVISFKNGHRLTLKSLFTHHPPTRKRFWCLMKGKAKIRLSYPSAMVLILP